ncbi:MAG: hypothetical protein AB7E48_00455 [Deferribacterales bacterium]
MERVGIFIIRYDGRFMVMPDGTGTLRGFLEEGETPTDAAVRVLANSAPCGYTGSPVFVISEKTEVAKDYLFAVRAAKHDGRFLSHKEPTDMVQCLAWTSLRQAEKKEKYVKKQIADKAVNS